MIGPTIVGENILASEALVLRSRKGEEITVQADIHRVADGWRSARSGLIAFVGLLVAIPAIILPPHGFFSLLALVAGGLAAYVAYARGLSVGAMTGTCGKCGAKMDIPAIGAWSDDQWVRCPSCKEPWKVGRPA
jgi:hypothetical protein